MRTVFLIIGFFGEQNFFWLVTTLLQFVPAFVCDMCNVLSTGLVLVFKGFSAFFRSRGAPSD